MAFFPTIDIMGRGKTDPRFSRRFQFQLLISALIISAHLASCRSIGGRTEVSVKSPTVEFYSRFGRRFPAKILGTRSRESKAETDPIYGVSKRAVPGGPDPLHNWLIMAIIIRWRQTDPSYVYKFLQFVASCHKIFISVIDRHAREQKGSSLYYEEIRLCKRSKNVKFHLIKLLRNSNEICRRILMPRIQTLHKRKLYMFEVWNRIKERRFKRVFKEMGFHAGMLWN